MDGGEIVDGFTSFERSRYAGAVSHVRLSILVSAVVGGSDVHHYDAAALVPQCRR